MKKIPRATIEAEIAKHWRPPEYWRRELEVIPRVGRNDPCPCGSGKKYKKCHGRPGQRTLYKVIA